MWTTANNGLCSLRTGVKIVAFCELMCTILFFISIFVNEMLSKIYPVYADDVDVYSLLQSCIITITLLKLFSSVFLMQSTFQNAPHKIFLWIVIACITYLTVSIVSLKLFIHMLYTSKSIVEYLESDSWECHVILTFLVINFVSVIELYIVTSYYKKENCLKKIKQYNNLKVIVPLEDQSTEKFDIIIDFTLGSSSIV